MFPGGFIYGRKETYYRIASGPIVGKVQQNTKDTNENVGQNVFLISLHKIPLSQHI